MRSLIAHAEGSPSNTLVLDASQLPGNQAELDHVLLSMHRQLAMERPELLSKYALISPAPHPMFDLNYRFAQLVPEPHPHFEFTGSCGHSILAAITVASRWGWLPGLTPGMRVRVHVENNGDSLVCEVDEAGRSLTSYTAHFMQPGNPPLASFLPTGVPSQRLCTEVGDVTVSIVDAGNPYVFVDARELGLGSSLALFTAGADLFERLQLIRREASLALGWDVTSVFPKIAAVGAYEGGSLAVRAISVPTWHPTLALTGAACLTVAAVISGTVVSGLAQTARCAPDTLTLQSPGGVTLCSCASTGSSLVDSLLYTSISGKRVRLLDTVAFDSMQIGREEEWRSRVLA